VFPPVCVFAVSIVFVASCERVDDTAPRYLVLVGASSETTVPLGGALELAIQVRGAEGQAASDGEVLFVNLNTAIVSIESKGGEARSSVLVPVNRSETNGILAGGMASVVLRALPQASPGQEALVVATLMGATREPSSDADDDVSAMSAGRVVVARVLIVEATAPPEDTGRDATDDSELGPDDTVSGDASGDVQEEVAP